jgi:drug/metabolite transporter (DMT)-like permease
MIAPVLGPIITADGRVLVAAVALSIWLALQGTRMAWREHWPALLVVGVTNSAIPFAAFAYAAMTLPAGYSAILNATAPLFSALLAALWFRDPLTPRKIIGLVAGIAGVALLVRLGPVAISGPVVLAVGAALIGAFSYAVASTYVKALARPVPPGVMATGSQWVAALALLPLAPFSTTPLEFSPTVVAEVLALGTVCTAFGYLLYFRLIRDVGPIKALTVTFLIPMFALVWGAFALGEVITLRMLVGAALVILATWLVLSAPAPGAPAGARLKRAREATDVR